MADPARAPPRGWELLHDTAKMDWTKLDLVIGLRSTFFVVTPIILGASTGYLREGLFAAIGANFITNTEGSGPGATRFAMLAAACLIEPAALALGTLVGTLGALAVPLVGLGVVAFLTMRSYRDWTQVGLISAIVFAVGVGLPGASSASAFERLWTSLAGDVWILTGVAIHMRLRRLRGEAARAEGLAIGGSREAHPFMVGQVLQSQNLRQAVMTGIATSVGLAIGLSLGLPRDIWIMITTIIAVRQGVGPTVSSTFALVTGTGIGSVVAALITLQTSNLWVIIALMTVFAFAMFSTRLVSQALFQAFVTPFLILLLNVIYPGDWWLALARIADVTIGGGIAIISVYILRWEAGLTQPGRGNPGQSEQPRPAQASPGRTSGYMQALRSSKRFGRLLGRSPAGCGGQAEDGP